MKKPIVLLSLLSAVMVFTGCAGGGTSSQAPGGQSGNSAQTGEKEASSLAVKSQPTKTEYFIGEEFDPTGCVITVTYDDNSTEDLDLSDERLTYTAPSTATEGTKTVRVRMGSAQTTFQVTVVAKTYDVTFDLNYDGAPAPTVVEDVKEGETVAKPDDPVRDGYDFQAWCTNKEGTEVFDFETAISSDLTLYAHWITAGATTYTVTFDLNYSYAPADPTQSIEEGKTAVRPETDPTRKGYDFTGWYTSAAATTEFNFETAITANTTIYAGWERNDEYTGTQEYVFEAEDISLKGLVGNGFSGTAPETAMIAVDNYGLGASNNRYLGYLYKQGMTLNFWIASDVAVSNVKLELSLSQEVTVAYLDEMKGVAESGVTRDDPIVYNKDNYTIAFNGQNLDYPDITFSSSELTIEGGETTAMLYSPMKKATISTTLSLQAGYNLVSLVTNNNVSMGGTMTATAPLIDCITLTATDAVLDWDASQGYPVDNY